MCKRVALCLIALLACGCMASTALAWEVIEWSGAPSSNWAVDVYHNVQIYAPGTYKFYATTSGPNGNPDEIRAISTPSCSGNVTLYIARDPNYGGGAAAQTSAPSRTITSRRSTWPSAASPMTPARFRTST